METCDNFQQLNKHKDGERDLVAQSGNSQRAVVRCKTAARTGSEFPSGVGETKLQKASNFIRVRPLKRRTIQPARLNLTGGRVVGEAALATMLQTKVVTRVSLAASRPYALAFGSGKSKAVTHGAGREVFYLSEISSPDLSINRSSYCINYPSHWRGWRV